MRGLQAGWECRNCSGTGLGHLGKDGPPAHMLMVLCACARPTMNTWAHSPAHPLPGSQTEERIGLREQGCPGGPRDHAKQTPPGPVTLFPLKTIRKLIPHSLLLTELSSFQQSLYLLPARHGGTEQQQHQWHTSTVFFLCAKSSVKYLIRMFLFNVNKSLVREMLLLLPFYR